MTSPGRSRIGRGVLRERLGEEVLVPTRVVGALERHGGRDHVVRELRGLGGERIDRDEQVELPQRVDDALLVGKRRRRVAAADDERAHAVGAGLEDLLGKDRRRQLTHERAHADAALEAALPRAHRRRRLRVQVAATAEHAGARVPVALAREATAHHVHRLHQVLGDVRVRAHVGPGAGLGHPARGAPEHARRFDDQLAVDAGDAARDLGRHRLDRGAERVEAVDPPRAEVDVVQTLGEDRAQQRGEQRDVGAGDELEVEVGVGGDLGAARVDDDELQAPRAAPPRGGAGRRAPGSR